MRKRGVNTEARTATVCFSVATASCTMARRSYDDAERRHHCLVGLVFVAFAFEAMLNHYGRILFSDWAERKKQRLRRKQWHREFFRAVNLTDYLGCGPYQTVSKCFNLRDVVAHGHTVEESDDVSVDEELDHTEVAREILFAPVGPEKTATITALEESLEALKAVEEDIESHGYYPDQEGPDGEGGEHLCECPLSVTGARIW